jgi:hypothetical protein
VRSRREILFRLRQEAGNLAMWVRAPRLRERAQTAPTPTPVSTRHPEAIATIADSILEHRFPLLGVTIETGPTIDWRRDYLHGVSSGTEYFRLVPYLDFAKVGDHKAVWELNRHQHLPVLAQAYRASGRQAYLDEAFQQIDSWLEANPYLRGINWASALEVGLRALSWGWFWELAGGEMPERLRERFLNALYQHGRYLEVNLSVYFSPNTHLLGEAVALHALGAWFPEWPRARRWREAGGRVVEEAIGRQVRDDGSHFEQSVYYHVYALDFFLLYRSLAGGGPAYDERLGRMAEFLHAVTGPAGMLPLIGDDDGGRLRHPYGDRMQFGRETLARCREVFPDREWRLESRLFRDSGFAVMTAGAASVVIKAGGFGAGSGGHSHSDVLSMVVRIANREILIDPGTYTYVADPAERDRFRGSAAHNTVRIDGRNQAIPAGPFRWRDKPEVKVRAWSTSAERDVLNASCAYAGFVHQRRVLLVKPETLVIVDSVEGPSGEHRIEQFWHLGAPEEEARFSFGAAAERVPAWRSRALASREAAASLAVMVRALLPVYLATVVDLSEAPRVRPVTVNPGDDAWVVRWGDRDYRL